jgi:hypothetical protein
VWPWGSVFAVEVCGVRRGFQRGGFGVFRVKGF